MISSLNGKCPSLCTIFLKTSKYYLKFIIVHAVILTFKKIKIFFFFSLIISGEEYKYDSVAPSDIYHVAIMLYKMTRELLLLIGLAII